MAVEASLDRFRRNWLLLVLPIVILFPAIVALKLLRIDAGDYFELAVFFAVLAWFVTAWIALRQMVCWQCPACRKPFFGEARIRVPRFREGLGRDTVTKCASCGTLLSS